MNLKLELNKNYLKKKKKIDYSNYLGKEYEKTTNYNEINNIRYTTNNNINSVNNISKKFTYKNYNSVNNNLKNNKKFDFNVIDNNNKIVIANSFNLTSINKDTKNLIKQNEIKNKLKKKDEKKFLFNVSGDLYKNSLFCDCNKFQKDNKFYNKICKNFYNFNLEDLSNEIYLTYSWKFEQYTIENKIKIENEMRKSKIKNEYIYCKIWKILLVFSTLKNNLNNFKGIKYVCHGLLYHMEEELVYFIFCDIYKKLNLDLLYNDNSIELSIHLKNLKILFENQFIEFYEFLEKNNISLEYFCTDWVLTICTKYTPFKKNYLLFNGILQENWAFIYRIILNYFKEIFLLIKKDKIYLKKLPLIKINWDSILK